MATIRDVAERAGVSVATVSHVMNESRFVAPETKARVQEAIRQLRYSRDEIARSLRRSKTGTIGLIVSDITNPFYSDLVRGVEQAIYGFDEKMTYILCNTEEDTARERIYLDVVREKRLDGLIIAPSGGNEDYLTDLVKQDFPLVLVDRALEDVEADTVVVDNEHAAWQMTRHLIGLGHHRILFLKATLRANSIEDRLRGYQRALKEAGIAFDPGLVVESASEIAAAERAGEKVLAFAERPDAVFCSNNFMTIGMMSACHSAGLECPNDLAIVSFDDFPWANAFHPRLTAIAQPSFQMGLDAVRLLFARSTAREKPEPQKIVLHTTLHLRESCGQTLLGRIGAEARL
jgi:LacI family transcriptional regulator